MHGKVNLIDKIHINFLQIYKIYKFFCSKYIMYLKNNSHLKNSHIIKKKQIWSNKSKLI